MLIGIFWALMAGCMLGLYALPVKYTRDFKFENTWGLFFVLMMFIIPLAATFALIGNLGKVFSQVDGWRLIAMIALSFLWGIGMMMWGKAINHIGVSLAFSLFIGTVIIVGSLLPLIVDGIPRISAFGTLLFGILTIVAGIVFNCKAGLIRERDQSKADGTLRRVAIGTESKTMAAGIVIAVVGGILAGGFSFADAVGQPQIQEACQSLGKPGWAVAIAVMFPIFLSGGVVTTLYFAWQLKQKEAWKAFRTPYFGRNLILISIMAFLQYAASAAFAFSAFKLGTFGNTVGYAIYNTTSVLVAVIGGIVAKEWVKTSSKARGYLYGGLSCMILGVLLITVGNALAP